MATLENVYHNFPRLAKQSGFHFQLHRGRVNWSEIENLDINEITEGRNFELLEQNLVNVTNCNLEREYDFKILDQNFVKLFKLAQLGVDYLSYCEIYLDRCVVLLQEQLMASQDECESLRKEIQKRKELNRSKSKNKTINYQCEKCAKVFISDVYLKYHEKRRHSSPNSHRSFEEPPQKCSCDFQKNENVLKVSTSTQTAFLHEEISKATPEKEDESSLKMEHLKKVEKLEHELQDLKERFKKAESALSEKNEAPKPNNFHSVNVPNNMQYNSTLMLLPSYLTHLGHGCCEIHPGCQKSVPEVCQSNSTLKCPGDSSVVSSNPAPVNNKLLTENTSEFKSESTASPETKCEALIEDKPDSNFQMGQSKAESLECEKENIDPKIKSDLVKDSIKPLPPPRKLKKVIREKSESLIQQAAKINECQEKKTETSSAHIIVRSTPIKEKLEEETNTEIFEESLGNISEIDKLKATSIESLQSKKSDSLEPKSKSFIKKIISRDSSSIQKLGKNFRKSLNSICDSVSFNEKEEIKKETNFQNIRSSVVEGLNNHLKQLGIDSNWTGIPKKTMKQKLRAWKHQRRLLTKENPLYPVIRQNIEETVFQKLKKNFKRKKSNSTNKLNKQEELDLTGSDIRNISLGKGGESVKSKNCLMYDAGTDSESTVSDSANFNPKEQNYSHNVIVEDITSSRERIDVKNDKESDITLFQTRGSRLNNLTDGDRKPVSINKQSTVFIDSDTESSLLNFTNNRGKEPLIDNSNVGGEKPQFELPYRLKTKAESLSILKDGEGFQPKPSNSQKKVIFETYSKDIEEELSDDPTEDDLWSLRSGWEKTGDNI